MKSPTIAFLWWGKKPSFAGEKKSRGANAGGGRRKEGKAHETAISGDKRGRKKWDAKLVAGEVAPKTKGLCIVLGEENGLESRLGGFEKVLP